MIKDFFFKKLLENKLADLPPEQKEKVLKAFEDNPELFAKIGEEIKTELANGKDQVSAAMAIAEKYKNELKDLLNKGAN